MAVKTKSISKSQPIKLAFSSIKKMIKIVLWPFKQIKSGIVYILTWVPVANQVLKVGKIIKSVVKKIGGFFKFVGKTSGKILGKIFGIFKKK